jgi:hypothetical protein
MPVNPNIAMGVRGIELQNPLAQYGQIAAIQNAQNQNALAQFQLSGAQREQESVNALNQAYQSAYNPQTGEIDINTLRKTLSTGGFGSKLPGLEKSLGELEKQRLEALKLKGEVTAQPTKLAAEQTNLVDAKLKQSRQFLENVTTPEQYIAWHESNHKDPILGPMLAARGVTADQARGRIMQAIQQGPAAFAQLINESKLGTEKFMELNKPQLSTKDIGGQVIDRTFEPLTGKLTELSRITKTPTIGEQTSQGQLTLARQKFAWEQANPGFELKEAEDGSIVGVNKRTLQAFPVTVGGAAPAAGAGMPGARATAPEVAPVTGTPLRGKGTALTETQSNATAFGLRMKEANSILTALEQSGVKNTGLISGVAGSIVGVVPLIGDKLEGMTGSVFNILPQIMGGLSPEQQQTAQARLNFITANLRKESGATLLPSEFITEERKYFPKPGDDATVIAQKQKARNLALKAMEIQAGPGAKNIQQYQTGADVGGASGAIPNATPTNPLVLTLPPGAR